MSPQVLRPRRRAPGRRVSRARGDQPAHGSEAHGHQVAVLQLTHADRDVDLLPHRVDAVVAHRYVARDVRMAMHSIGPWLTNVSGETTPGASIGLLSINIGMLVVFLAMGHLSPRFIKSAADADTLLRRFTPASIAALGREATWVHFALFCVAAWPLSVTHPLVGQRFDAREAGRAIAFVNLLLFLGVFLWQWGLGMVVSALLARAYDVEAAYRVALAGLVLLSAGGYAFFVGFPRPTAAIRGTAPREAGQH